MDVLKTQMESGDGELLGAFSGAAGLLGMLNPLSWFAPAPAPPPLPPPEPAEPRSPVRSPVQSYGEGKWPYQEGSPTYEELYGPTSATTPRENARPAVIRLLAQPVMSDTKQALEYAYRA